jgi:type I restriction enzyme S subunit
MMAQLTRHQSANGWTARPIRELCSSIIDCVNKTAPVVEGPTPYRMIRTTNVKNGRVNVANVRYVEEDTYRRWVRRGEPREGDIVLTREAPLGEVGMLRDAAGVFLGQRLVMYRADPERADHRFLMYAMRGPTVQHQIKAFGSGSTVEHMRVPDCGELLIPCPGISAQRRIGAVLAAFDELIEINERRIALLEVLARSLYREWFVRFRFPGHKNTQLADSELGQVPDSWSVRRLDEVASQVTRGVAPRYAEDGAWLVINQRCIRDERVSLASARRQDRVVAQAKQVRFGDVLINSTGVGTLGRVAMFLLRTQQVTADSHVTIVRPQSVAASAWLALCLRARQAELEAIGTGSTGQTELSRQAVGNLRVVVPDDRTMRLFSDAASSLLRAVPELVALNEQLAATRDLLIPRLVTGRLDISDIDLGALLSGPEEA